MTSCTPLPSCQGLMVALLSIRYHFRICILILAFVSRFLFGVIVS